MQNKLESENELVDGCRAGKDWARKRLYTLYASQMLAVSYRYVGDMDLAHDLLHDGFIKIYTRFTYRGEGALGSWLNRVIANVALDYLRKKKQMQEIVMGDEQFPEVEEIDDPGLYGGISNEKLLEFIAELPVGCRTVFNLYVFEDCSHQEIGELLNIKEHTSTSQYHRAKYMLMEKIKKYLGNEAGQR